MKIQFSVDGGATWQDAPEGIRVTMECPEHLGDLHMNVTSEGVILDELRGEEGFFTGKTACFMHDDLLGMLQ